MRPAPVTEAILKALRFGPLTQPDLVARTQLPRERVKNAIQHLREIGKIERTDGRTGTLGPMVHAAYRLCANPGRSQKTRQRRTRETKPSAAPGAPIPPRVTPPFTGVVRHRDEKIATLERVLEWQFLGPRGRDLVHGMINDYRRTRGL